MQIEIQFIKSYFKTFLSQEAGASGSNKEKEPQKPHPNLKKIYIYMLTIERTYLLCLPSNASGSRLQTCTDFVERQLKFSHFEGSIIP